MNVLHRLGWLQFVLLAASVANAVETSTVLPPNPDEPLFAAPTSVDRIGRILAPVMVNGQGPFRFVVDTGANYTTVAPRLLNALGLQMGTEQQKLVHGVTGTALVPTVLIDKLQAGSLVMEHTYMPVVQTSINLQAHGILGVAGLQQARVFVDFRRDSVVISRSRVPRGELSSYFVLDAQRVEGGLLAVNVVIRGVRAKAVIDTGAEVSLGNIALRDAIRARHRRRTDPKLTDVFGATEQVTQGEVEGPSNIEIGDITINHVAVTYGDFHIFEAWHLKNRPAMLIGMDVLGVADALVIDFRSRQILVRRQSSFR
ncbi:MAG TPA: aspartyl protease family protein [Steroidobacteraceae bacterium]|nr:aspartyl protease family protein [Steroidobacteraceae bacterium]